MKQRIRVIGVVKNGEEVLFLRKAQGRAEVATAYELPTGKINFGEQPEEAMTRLVYDYLGTRADSVKLLDAVTFMELAGASELANLFIVYDIGLTPDSVKITTEKFIEYRWVEDTEIGAMLIDEASLSVLEILEGRKKNVVKNTEYRGGEKSATIYTDGGSRGNPGPSGVGYCVVAEDGSVIKRGGEFIGFSTSRLAEYYGLKEGIEQAIELGLKSVRFKLDSLMVVNQMNGVYRVKNKDLTHVYEDIWKLLEGLDSYSFEHISRYQNVEADREVNRVIDENYRKRK